MIGRYEIVTFCPKCGRQERVTKGSILMACWFCTMKGADRVEAESRKRSDEYDWREIILKIRRAEKITQEFLAFTLKISPAMLTQVKKGRRAIPTESFAIIKEKFSKHITLKKQVVTA